MPFTEAQFLGVFGDYNDALWPAAALLWLLTAFALALLAARQAHGRLIGGLLAVHWLWTGGVYHLVYFRAINPAAHWFGAAFVLQGLLFLWYGVVKGRLEFQWGRSPRQIASAVIAGYALLYPALVLLAGFHWPEMPAFGVPCPTAILTMGLLLAMPPASYRGLGIIPLLWAVIGGSAAKFFGVLPDYMMIAAGSVLLAFIVAPRMPIWGSREGAAAR